MLCKGNKVRSAELLNISESLVAMENVDKVIGPPYTLQQYRTVEV